MKLLTTAGLTKLIQLIKSSFIKIDDTVETNTLDIDTTVTSGSANLITSGAVFSYHDATKQNITDNTLTTTSKNIVGAINEINAKPSGSVEIDEQTITTNSDDELQAIAVIDNSGNALKTWTGTKAQYDAITTKDSNTLYNITDDSDITLTLLETIYPVGSIYITTNATCPLSALFGTWQLVGADRVLQGAGTRGSVGTTLNESLPNIKGNLTASIFNGSTIDGAFEQGTLIADPNGTGGVNTYNTTFDASRSSSTYQDNAPVQPDAYLVNIFRRTV